MGQQPTSDKSPSQPGEEALEWADDDELSLEEAAEVEQHVFRVLNPASPISERFKP